jgi:hypothetical protein
MRSNTLKKVPPFIPPRTKVHPYILPLIRGARGVKGEAIRKYVSNSNSIGIQPLPLPLFPH